MCFVLMRTSVKSCIYKTTEARENQGSKGDENERELVVNPNQPNKSYVADVLPSKAKSGVCYLTRAG